MPRDAPVTSTVLSWRVDILFSLTVQFVNDTRLGLPTPTDERRAIECGVCSRIHSTIHGKIRSRDVGGFRTRDKRRHCGYLLNMPIAVECCGGLLWYGPIT